MNDVILRHPDLGEMHVHPLTVPSWRARGWERVEEQATVENAPAKAPVEKETPRRRRAQKESE